MLVAACWMLYIQIKFHILFSHCVRRFFLILVYVLRDLYYSACIPTFLLASWCVASEPPSPSVVFCIFVSVTVAVGFYAIRVRVRAATITFLWSKLRKLYPWHYFLVIFPFSIFGGCICFHCLFAAFSFSYIDSVEHLPLFALSLLLSLPLTLCLFFAYYFTRFRYVRTLNRMLVEPIRIERGNEKQREKKRIKIK